MRLKSILFIAAMAIIFSVGSSFTSVKKDATVWVLLGDKRVGFGVDHYVINFGNWKDDVRQIKLKVTDGPLKMFSMKIHFDNGSVQDVELRNHFAQGSESRVIDLDGGLRHLSKIEFWYETKGFVKGKARVAVWGKN